jgi:hypothetical protein
LGERTDPLLAMTPLVAAEEERKAAGGVSLGDPAIGDASVDHIPLLDDKGAGIASGVDGGAKDVARERNIKFDLDATTG